VPQVTEQTDAQGRRTVVTLHDDRGKPYKFVSSVVSVLSDPTLGNPGPFQSIAEIALNEDPNVNPPRPNLLRGQLFVGTNISFDNQILLFDYVLAEVLVIGYVGGTGTVIAHGELGALQTSMRASFEASDTFDRIAVLGRQLVGSGGLTTPSVCELTVVALMWS
jgi:hypothetical protein